MAVRTSSQAGVLSSTSTWGGNPPPGNNDQAVANHNVTVDIDTIIGLSNAASGVDYAITVNGGGQLTIPSGITLTVRGNTLQTGQTGGGANIIVKGKWKWDASQATSPLLQNYKAIVGNTSVAVNAKFIVSGVPGTLATIESNRSGGNGYFSNLSNYNGGLHDWQYFEASDIGYSGQPAITSSSMSDEFAHLFFKNGKWNRCYEIESHSIQPDVDIDVQECVWQDSFADSRCLDLRSNNANQTGTRIFHNNSFDKSPTLPTINASLSGNFFPYGWSTLQGAGLTALNTHNVIRLNTNDTITRCGSWTDNFICVDGNNLNLFSGIYIGGQVDVNNPHWTIIGTVGTGIYEVKNSIFEDFGSNGEGDIDYVPASMTDFHSEFRYNIILPSQSKQDGVRLNSGTLTTNEGIATSNHKYEHNTFYGGGQGALALAELGTNGFANMIDSYQSNIIWNDPYYSGAGFNYMAYYPTSPAGAVHDMITVTACNYNCGWNIRNDGSNSGTGNTNRHYNIRATVPLGENDIYENPQFFDSNRTFTTWVQSIIGAFVPGSGHNRDYNAYGLYLLYLNNQPNHSDYNSSATLSNLFSYIRTGFRPQNMNLYKTAHDGTYIGAVEIPRPKRYIKLFSNSYKKVISID